MSRGADLKNYAIGDGRQLATLLGHFNVTATLKGVNKYGGGEVNNFDFTLYIGFNPRNTLPSRFLEYVLATDRPVIWMRRRLQEATPYGGMHVAIRGGYIFTDCKQEVL